MLGCSRVSGHVTQSSHGVGSALEPGASRDKQADTVVLVRTADRSPPVSRK